MTAASSKGDMSLRSPSPRVGDIADWVDRVWFRHVAAQDRQFSWEGSFSRNPNKRGDGFQVVCHLHLFIDLVVYRCLFNIPSNRILVTRNIDVLWFVTRGGCVSRYCGSSMVGCPIVSNSKRISISDSTDGISSSTCGALKFGNCCAATTSEACGLGS